MHLFVVYLALCPESITNILDDSDIIFLLLVHIVSCLVILLGYNMLKGHLILLN